MRNSIIFLFFLGYSFSLIGQNIVSGPMVGYAAMRESVVWIQLDGPATTQLKYKPKGATTSYQTSDICQTEKVHGFTAHLIAESLSPSTVYEYIISINGKEIKPKYEQTFTSQELWQWRKDAPDIEFVAGSCFYVNEADYDRPGKPYGSEYRIFEAIYKDSPDFMVWLGDNTYTREVDWDSKSGIYHRYSHTRALPELQPLLANTHHYATWDDHDYGPNDSERSYFNKDLTRQAFVDFWANQNIGVGGSEGVTNTFLWSDCQYFMMDNRWYRTSDKLEDRHIIGKVQMDWLKDALLYSTASFKFICIGGQFVSDAAVFENHANFPEERLELLDFIDKYQIKNVVFLTGDRHHSEVSKLVTAHGTVVHDITSSALTSGGGLHLDEPNHHRVSGSMVGERNYALIKIVGTRGNRKLQMEYKGAGGESYYKYEIEAQK